MDIDSRDLVHLARYGVEGRRADVLMLVRRLARRIREASPEVASQLQRLVKQHSDSQPARGKAVAHLPVDLESRLELASVERDVRLKFDPIWNPQVAASLLQVVAERENEEALSRADLHPAKSLLFVGPPGVGKTISAKWLAARLGIPLVTLDLAAVMSSFLGRTGNNLRNILDYAKGLGCVLLLDEFDSIAKRRDDAVEVGELKRLVTVLLQEIDQWPESGMLVAATNHPELLDPAVWRRFDLVMNFDLPDDDRIRVAVSRILEQQEASLIDAIAFATKGMSFSDIERELLRAKRQSVLEKAPLDKVLESMIRNNISGRSVAERKAVAMQLVSRGVSQRRTHDLTGVSRDTIRNQAASGEGDGAEEG